MGRDHSFAAEYDANKPITASRLCDRRGMDESTRLVYVHVKDENGNVWKWELELESLN